MYYQIHNHYRYTSNFSMMNFVAIVVIIFQTLVVFIGCELGLINNNIELIGVSSLAQVFPCLLMIIHKRKAKWFLINFKIKSFIKKEFKGALNTKTKQVLDMIPLTVDRIFINYFLGSVQVTLFYASMVLSNVVSFVTKLLGQLTSQHLRVSEKKNH